MALYYKYVTQTFTHICAYSHARVYVKREKGNIGRGKDRPWLVPLPAG